ncbi:MAG: hypothetical protein ABI289_10935 [Candidatus Dormibacter sp.]
MQYSVRAYASGRLDPLIRHSGPSRRPSESRTVTTAQATILGLQRSVGNRALADLFAVQRCGPTPCGCSQDERDAHASPPDATSAQRQEKEDPQQEGAAAAVAQPIFGAYPEVTYDGLDALQDRDDPSGDTAQLQRDGVDAGGTHPTGSGTSCTVFTSFADYFKGTAPNSPFAAMTSFNFVVRAGRIAVDPDTASSWVNQRVVPVNGRPAQTARAVSGCQSAFRKPDMAEYTYSPSPSCPASASLRQPATATNRGECETVIGTQLDTEDIADMARLLRHEQYHLNLACALATLGNNLIAQGTPVADVRAQVVAASRRLQIAYDTDTNHGCNTGPQATWESNIDSGSIAFP